MVVLQRCMFEKILADTQAACIYGQELTFLLRFTRCLWAWQLCAAAIGLKLARIQTYTPWSQHDPEMRGMHFFSDLSYSNLPMGCMVEDFWEVGGNGTQREDFERLLACMSSLCSDSDVIFGNNELTNVGAAWCVLWWLVSVVVFSPACCILEFLQRLSISNICSWYFRKKWLAKFVCDTEEADCGKVIENYQAFTFVMKLRS